MEKEELKTEIERLNGVVKRAQEWVEEMFPELTQPLHELITESEKDKKSYSALTCLAARCVYEGEIEALDRINHEYVLADHLRGIVERMKDNQDADTRIAAWEELKELLSL